MDKKEDEVVMSEDMSTTSSSDDISDDEERKLYRMESTNKNMNKNINIQSNIMIANNILDMPDDILCLCFKWLKTSELVKTELTCQMFNKIIHRNRIISNEGYYLGCQKKWGNKNLQNYATFYFKNEFNKKKIPFKYENINNLNIAFSGKEFYSMKISKYFKQIKYLCIHFTEKENINDNLIQQFINHMISHNIKKLRITTNKKQNMNNINKLIKLNIKTLNVLSLKGL